MRGPARLVVMPLTLAAIVTPAFAFVGSSVSEAKSASSRAPPGRLESMLSSIDSSLRASSNAFPVPASQSQTVQSYPPRSREQAVARLTIGPAVGYSLSSFPTVVVQIGVNNTVVWTNSDSSWHTVTALDGSFGSGNIWVGGSYSHTIEVPGTYLYVCEYHVPMRGSVIVRA